MIFFYTNRVKKWKHIRYRYQHLETATSCSAQPGSKSLKDSKKESIRDDVSLEERAKAVEMGLRIGLIIDEDTEKKYLDIFLVGLCNIKFWQAVEEQLI